MVGAKAWYTSFGLGCALLCLSGCDHNPRASFDFFSADVSTWENLSEKGLNDDVTFGCTGHDAIVGGDEFVCVSFTPLPDEDGFASLQSKVEQLCFITIQSSENHPSDTLIIQSRFLGKQSILVGEKEAHLTSCMMLNKPELQVQLFQEGWKLRFYSDSMLAVEGYALESDSSTQGLIVSRFIGIHDPLD